MPEVVSEAVVVIDEQEHGAVIRGECRVITGRVRRGKKRGGTTKTFGFPGPTPTCQWAVRLWDGYLYEAPQPWVGPGGDGAAGEDHPLLREHRPRGTRAAHRWQLSRLRGAGRDDAPLHRARTPAGLQPQGSGRAADALARPSSRQRGCAAPRGGADPPRRCAARGAAGHAPEPAAPDAALPRRRSARLPDSGRTRRPELKR